MDVEYNLVPYYRELLIKAVPGETSSISQCVLKGWLHELGNALGMEGMRLYLFDDRSNNVFVNQIFGDKVIWRDVDITRFRKERTKYKNLFFIKIRHIRENGQFLILGYLAFHAEYYVSSELMMSLEVLCMLYGNYIVKRLVEGQHERMSRMLTDIYSISASEDLPGTKVLKMLERLHALEGFNFGMFCTVHDVSIVPEYVATNKGCIFLHKHKEWKDNESFIEGLLRKPRGHWFCLSEIPKAMADFILFRDKRGPEYFYVQAFPINVDCEVVGLWVFVYSENNPYECFNTNNIIEGTFPLLKDSYRFLFQRRFNSMIVNPIFQNRDTRIKQNSVFIIMPFSESWSKDIWEQVLKPAIQEIGMLPIRADDLYGQNIMEDVWQSLLQASIVICDTTGRNPNVFYELGIAHTLGKKVLLLTQNIEDIPFDLRALRHIEYKITISGGNELKETVKKHIQETLQSK